MARQRHLYTFHGVRLELRYTYMYKSRYTHVTHQYLQKSLLEQNPTGSQLFLIFSANFVIFANFMCHTLTNSS